MLNSRLTSLDVSKNTILYHFFYYNDNFENESSWLTLKGTQWKLEGMVDVQTETLKVLNLIRSNTHSYTLSFLCDANNTWGFAALDYFREISKSWCEITCSTCQCNNAWRGYTRSNEIFGIYEIDYATSSFRFIRGTGGTSLVNDGEEARLYYNTLYDVHSFFLGKKELRLYYDSENNYLLYKPF